MKILSMRASFGKLQNEELTLKEGLNILCAPNEFGKTTWSAFLLAMFYGIDSSERTSKSNLPAKVRYKPWSGGPMEGSIDLEHQGRRITIERTSSSLRSPMNQFRAYDTDTGQPIGGLTGETCGLALLGVERSVFERSGFLRQAGLQLSKDASLEQRLGCLVTTGDESVSYIETEQSLRALKNRCWHNATGLLPQARAELQAVESSLEQLHREGQALVGLRARQMELQKERDDAAHILSSLQQIDALAKKAKLDQAAAALEQARCPASRQAEAAQHLPAVFQLRQLLTQLDSQQERLQTLALDEAVDLQEPQRPACPDPFRDLEPEHILQKAQTDAETLQKLSAPKRAPSWPLFCALALLIAAAGVFFLHKAIAAAASLAAAAFLAVFAVLRKRASRMAARQQAEAAALLEQYGAASFQQLLPLAQSYCSQLDQYRQALEALQAQRQDLRSQCQQAQTALAATMADVRSFAPHAQSVAACRQALQDALQLRQEAELAQRDVQRAKQQYDDLYQAVGQLPAVLTAPQQDFSGQFTAEEAARRLSSAERQLADVAAQLAQGQGKLSALGDPLELEARKAQLQERIDALTLRYSALELALESLAAANEQLRSRFSPQLCREAGRIMACLTGQRYDKVFLSGDLDVAARESGSPVTHDLRTLSAGTGDQLYFAVRLAICRLLLPPDVPIVLDDALVYFDDNRAKQALALLKEEAKTRQVLLFTCQQREQRLLDAL